MKTITKISYLILFITPMVFIGIIGYIKVQIISSGFSTEFDYKDLLIIPLGIYYMYLIIKKNKNTINEKQTWTLMTSTALIFSMAFFNAIGYMFLDINSYNIPLISSLLIVSISCIIIIIDGFKSVKKYK